MTSRDFSKQIITDLFPDNPEISAVDMLSSMIEKDTFFKLVSRMSEIQMEIDDDKSYNQNYMPLSAHSQ